LWSIILAGGNGERLRPAVQRWLGRHQPKQYCTFIGTRSMFQHTLDRSDRIVTPERRVTVIAREHREDALAQLASRPRGNVILQPSNRETAAGIFLGLTYVRAHDPQATVLIFPSDHFVYPEEAFMEMASSLARAAKHLKHWIFLLGASPDSPEPEYGWIQPGAHLGWIDGYRVRGMQAFLEKPNLDGCKDAMRLGALWNTMVIAARVDTLWNLGLRCFPEMMQLLEVYRESVGTHQENLVLDSIYQVMPSRNFSAHLLQEFPKHVAVMELRGVLWSDWGKPERITETLRRIGKEPVFCRAHIA
ncbi:MAG TPA: sugar phosphate nucleotidyltransferase, partial [Terriglobia bacterium]|nr:sugar phosphate nucleotidyltransferase [Terriglobia bacterium]